MKYEILSLFSFVNSYCTLRTKMYKEDMFSPHISLLYVLKILVELLGLVQFISTSIMKGTPYHVEAFGFFRTSMKKLLYNIMKFCHGFGVYDA